MMTDFSVLKSEDTIEAGGVLFTVRRIERSGGELVLELWAPDDDDEEQEPDGSGSGS